MPNATALTIRSRATSTQATPERPLLSSNVRAPLKMYTHTTAMLFWSMLSLPSLIVSGAYFFASPKTESLLQKLSVSAHGVLISALYLSALLVGGFGHPRQEYGSTFVALLWLPAIFIAYSFWRFNGKKSTHLLQIINLIFLLFTAAFSGMPVTGVWP